MLSALAAGNISFGTSLGIIACRAGLPTAKNADCTATTKKSTPTELIESADCNINNIEQPHRPSALINPTSRRSNASDKVPPYKPKPIRGINWNSPTRPTIKLDLVRS